MASKERLRLAVLDDYASLSLSIFEPLRESQLLAAVSYYDKTLDTRTKEGLEAAIERLKPYHIISSMRERTQFPKELISQLPNLRLLMNSGARNRSIDTDTAKKQGVIVTATDGRYAKEMSPSDYDNTTQHTWSLILALTSGIPEDNYILRHYPDVWQTGFTVSLAGKTIGLVGLGKLGGRTARTAVLGFGMKVIAWSENLTQDKADELAREFGLDNGTFKVVSKQEVFSQSDIVSLHLVFSDRTKNIVGQTELSAMKETAFLVNTARAGLVDEDALFNALNEGRIAGAALDVWWSEPIDGQSRWRQPGMFHRQGRGRLIMSPHMGYVEFDVMNGWYKEQAKIIEDWSKGVDLKDRLLKSN